MIVERSGSLSESCENQPYPVEQTNESGGVIEFQHRIFEKTGADLGGC